MRLNNEICISFLRGSGWLNNHDKEVIDEFVNFANTMPTIETDTVKHGSWFLLDECANEGVYCSVCHKKVYKLNYANQKLKSKYCPNCGAVMDLEGE